MVPEMFPNVLDWPCTETSRPMLSRSNDARIQDLVDIQHLQGGNRKWNYEFLNYRSPLGRVLAKLFRVATLLQRLAKVFNTIFHWCQGLFHPFSPIPGFIFLT